MWERGFSFRFIQSLSDHVSSKKSINAVATLGRNDGNVSIRIKVGRMGRWDIPTTIYLVGFVRGRKTSSDKVDSARELRHEGCSVREIARRLRISKSAAHRFTQDIKISEGTQAAEAPEAQEETFQSVPEEEREDPELITLREQLDDLQFETAVAVMDRDTIAAGQIQRKLSQHRRMANRYFQRRLCAIGIRSTQAALK